MICILFSTPTQHHIVNCKVFCGKISFKEFFSSVRCKQTFQSASNHASTLLFRSNSDPFSFDVFSPAQFSLSMFSEKFSLLLNFKRVARYLINYMKLMNWIKHKFGANKKVAKRFAIKSVTIIF